MLRKKLGFKFLRLFTQLAVQQKEKQQRQQETRVKYTFTQRSFQFGVEVEIGVKSQGSFAQFAWQH